MAENVFDRAKDAVVGAVRGTGDIVGSVGRRRAMS